MNECRIGVISDTHIPASMLAIPAGVFTAFEGVSAICHLGDSTSSWVLDDLRAIAPVFAVRGNMDHSSLKNTLPEQMIVEFCGARFALVHGWGAPYDLPERAAVRFKDEKGLACVLFGHTHAPYCRDHNGLLLFNPGSCAGGRGHNPSVGIIDISAGSIHPSRIPL